MMKERKEWKVREGSEKDMEGILSLREIVFRDEEKDKLDPRFWKWQIMNNPDGIGWTYLVEDGNHVIGHLADLPKRFSVRERVVLGTLTHDMMVHPNYRRVGISNATARYGIQKVKRENGFFMTAYPIRMESLNSLLKVGWKEVTRLPVLVFPIRFYGIVKHYLHFKWISLLGGGIARLFFSFLLRRRKYEGVGLEIKRIDELDEQFDLFWKRIIPLFPIIGVRDRTYLNWRYLQHPTRNYAIYQAQKGGEMRGYIVLRKVALLNFNSAVVVDLLALDKETLTGLVEKGIQHSRQEGADLLGMMISKTHPYYRSLRKMGFLPSLKSFHFLVYSHWGEGILFDPEAWYLTWGDTDVI